VQASEKIESEICEPAFKSNWSGNLRSLEQAKKQMSLALQIPVQPKTKVIAKDMEENENVNKIV
jgi:hypothetical protein